MEKMLEFLKPSPEDFSKTNITQQQWVEFAAFLKQRSHLYREENARLEAVFTKLMVGFEDLKFLIQTSNSLSEICNTLEDIQTKVLSNNSIALSHAERLRKHSNYVSKMKICIKIYMNLNERLIKEIKNAKRELENAKIKVEDSLNVDVIEIRQLEEKAKRYENDLMKFEEKYAWLKNPELNLPNITKETDMLKNLKETREKLIQELSIFRGLKPDLKEASQQLADIKEENKNFVLSKFS